MKPTKVAKGYACVGVECWNAMKTIFDKNVHDELLERLAKLEISSERRWGKMSPAQMMEHVARALDLASGRVVVKQSIIGKLLSWMVIKKFLGDGPVPNGAPTSRVFLVQEDPNFESTRARLIDLITAFHGEGESAAEGRVHRFFGPLTCKQWGETQYKHIDHHLRQFGV